jgi:FkbM family methyltransferase
MKRLIKRILKASGYEMHKYIPGSSSTAQLASSLRNFNIDLILDVGANVGQFGEELRHAGYRGGIVSYEPLPDAYGILATKLKSDALWRVYERTAIGSHNGEIVINVAGNSASSSVLPMLEKHLEAAPHSAYIDKVDVPIKRLDDTLGEDFHRSLAPFLKIDTQGYEWDVLDGAAHALEKCQGVLVELSFVPLYEGQHLWLEVLDRLQKSGFSLWALQPGFTDNQTGQMLQADGIFFKV